LGIGEGSYCDKLCPGGVIYGEIAEGKLEKKRKTSWESGNNIKMKETGN
jgi:hypothetical protein